MIPIIELSGSYLQIGQQFGSRYKSEIKTFAESRMVRLISFVERYGKVKVNEQEVLNIASSLLNAQQQYDLDLWQEFLGISIGAEISLEWLFVLNSYTDLRDYICKLKGFNDLEIRLDGCTGFILDKTMTVDNKIMLGQTWDMSVEAMDYLVIVKKTPKNSQKDNLSMLYLTTMGCLALIGINNNNLAIGTTNLMANDCCLDQARLGINYLCTISKALKTNINFNNYNNILDLIINTNRLSGHSFLCASANQANLIEASAQNYLNYKLDHFPLIKTNNYSDAMASYQMFTPELRQRNSMYRYGRALSILTSKAKWSTQDLWEQVLGDCIRSDSGSAICNQDYNGKYSEFATLASVLLIPETKTMWICRGGVNTSQRQEIVL